MKNDEYKIDNWYILNREDLMLISWWPWWYWRDLDSYYYLTLFIILECCKNIQQEISFNDLSKFYNLDEYVIYKIITSLNNIYKDFKITQWALLIDYYDKYIQNLQKEISIEENIVKKSKQEEILNDFKEIDKFVLKKRNYNNRFYLDREKFNYNKWFWAFNYMREDITIFLDIFPNWTWWLDKINKKLKYIFDNIDSIKRTIEMTSVINEINDSDKLLLEISWWKKWFFKLPFNKIYTKWINFIRLIKYWELKWFIKIESWLGEKGYWNCELLKNYEEKTESEKNILIDKNSLYNTIYYKNWDFMIWSYKNNINNLDANNKNWVSFFMTVLKKWLHHNLIDYKWEFEKNKKDLFYFKSNRSIKTETFEKDHPNRFNNFAKKNNIELQIINDLYSWISIEKISE